MTDEGASEPFCYFLLEATGDRLEYSYLPRGNTLSFERLPGLPEAARSAPGSAAGLSAAQIRELRAL